VGADGDVVLCVAEDEEDDEGDGDGDEQGVADAVHGEVGQHGDEAADEVAQAHGDAREPGGVRFGLVEAQADVHLEAEPGVGVCVVSSDNIVRSSSGVVAGIISVVDAAAQLVDERGSCRAGHGVAVQDGVDVLTAGEARCRRGGQRRRGRRGCG